MICLVIAGAFILAGFLTWLMPDPFPPFSERIEEYDTDYYQSTGPR